MRALFFFKIYIAWSLAIVHRYSVVLRISFSFFNAALGNKIKYDEITLKFIITKAIWFPSVKGLSLLVKTYTDK